MAGRRQRAIVSQKKRTAPYWVLAAPWRRRAWITSPLRAEVAKIGW